jgi:hypothetical protein
VLTFLINIFYPKADFPKCRLIVEYNRKNIIPEPKNICLYSNSNPGYFFRVVAFVSAMAIEYSEVFSSDQPCDVSLDDGSRDSLRNVGS